MSLCTMNYSLLPEHSQYFHHHSPHPASFQFPTSSTRDDAVPAPTEPHKRYDPLGIFKQAEDAARRTAILADTQYSTDVPRPFRVAPGVLSDGSITIGHPEIRHFLQSAESNPRIALPTSPSIFALAALGVFYHPNRPAHWIFWSKEKRENTAHIVQKVLDVQPVLIKSPISWVGIPESLWVLCNLQYGWREELAKTSWYADFIDTASAPGKLRMNLRKRKALRDQPPLQLAEDEAVASPAPSQRKRPRTRRIRPTALSKRTPCVEDGDDETPVSNPAKECVTNPTPSSSKPPSPAPDLPASALQQNRPTASIAISDSPAGNSTASQQRTSLRQKAQRAKATLPLVVPSDTPTPRTRDLSPSSISASGCSTAVARGRGRSSSSASASLSVATAVEADAAGDGKLGTEEEEVGEGGSKVGKRRGEGRERVEEKEEKAEGEEKEETDTTPVAPRTRASTRTRLAKDQKAQTASDTTEAPSKPKACTPPHATDQQEQVASGRGTCGDKAASMTAKKRQRRSRAKRA